MPLHRDIHWIGRQWAVTGHGMQLIDQKLQGFFDIEAARLWDDILIESVHAKEWLNRTDFDKGLALARARHPQPSGAETPLRQAAPIPAFEPVTPLPQVAKLPEPKLEIPTPAAPPLLKPASVEPPRAVGELKVPAIATRAPVEPRTAATPPLQTAPPPAIEQAAPPQPVVKTPEPKLETPKLEIPKPAAPTIAAPPIPKPASIEPPRAELKAPAIAARRPVEPPAAVTPPRQAARPIEPAAPLPPIVEPAEPKRGTLKLGVSEPVTVTLINRRPVEAPAAVTPPPQAAPPAAAVRTVEPRRAVAEPPAPAIATHASSVEPPRSLSLFQMRYECRARFVRPWRVVARKI